MEPEPAFVMGMMFGALLLWFVQTLLRSRRSRKQAQAELAASKTDRGRLREIEELHERLAVLERIATDPAHRTASEIDGLR